MYEELTPTTSGRLSQHVELSPNLTAQMLRKDLESELKLDNSDLRSYAWYHGRLPRDVAEDLVKNDGDFLIRESISNAGEHVLSMRWKGSIPHFKINKFVMAQSAVYSKNQFAFERDSFDSIPALIMFHFGKSIPISVASGAVIRTPINRALPLSYSDVKYASLRREPKRNGSVQRTAAVSPQSASSNTSSRSSNLQPTGSFHIHTGEPYVGTPNKNWPTTNARFPATDNKHSPYNSHSPQPFPLQLPNNSSSPRPHSQVEIAFNNHEKLIGRTGSDPSLNPSRKTTRDSDGIGPLPTIQNPTRNSGEPPKPSRIPSFRRPVIRHESNKAFETGANNLHQTPKEQQQAKQSNTTNARYSGVSPTSPSSSNSSVIMRTSSPRSVSSLMESGRASSQSSTSESRKSIFNPLAYHSTLLPEFNKPVDGDVMIEIKKLLLGTDSFKLARHMTSIDCEVCKINDMGLEEVFLTKGKQLRCDILERYQCFAFWVAVCILRGGTNKQEKVDILNVFIQIANELVHSLGNVFGFSAIMHGLTCPQLRDLGELWTALQQQYTNNAVTMEKKLLPLMKLLDAGEGQIRFSSTSAPHILPVLRFLENPLDEIRHSSPRSRASFKKQLSASEGNMLGSVASEGYETSFWWQNYPDDSFDSLMAQLSLSRTIIASLPELQQNFNNKFQDFERKPKLHELFTTDFQLRLLWGYKGAESPQKERYQKFDKVITLMAKRITS